MNKFQTFIIRSVSPVKKYARLCMKTSIKTFAELPSLFTSKTICTGVSAKKAIFNKESYRLVYGAGYDSDYNDPSTKSRVDFKQAVNLIFNQSGRIVTSEMINELMVTGNPLEVSTSGVLCKIYFTPVNESEFDLHKFYN